MIKYNLYRPMCIRWIRQRAKNTSLEVFVIYASQFRLIQNFETKRTIRILRRHAVRSLEPKIDGENGSSYI